MNTKSLIMEYVTMRTYQKESWVGWSAETMNLISLTTQASSPFPTLGHGPSSSPTLSSDLAPFSPNMAFAPLPGIIFPGSSPGRLLSILSLEVTAHSQIGLLLVPFTHSCITLHNCLPDCHFVHWFAS